MKTPINNKWIPVALATAFFAFSPIQHAVSLENPDGAKNREKIARVETKSSTSAKPAEVKKFNDPRAVSVDLDYWINWKRQIIWPLYDHKGVLLPAGSGC
jgi:hypothetical protein